MWPIALAAGMAVTSMGSSYYQIKQANKQARREAQMSQTNRLVQLKSLHQQREQMAEATSLTLEQRNRQQLREESTLRAAFGSANVTGNTPLRQIYTSQLQAEYDKNIDLKNLESGIGQSYFEEFAVNIGTDANIAAAKASQVKGWAAALMIGSSAFQSGVTGYSVGSQI